MRLYGDTQKLYDDALGKTIVEASFDASANHSDGGLNLKFSDGTSLQIYDNAQSCCENRYITCDDNPTDLVGKPFAGIEEKEENAEDDGGYVVHETMFVEVKAGFDSITLVTHNEHNGYYGGFGVSVKKGE